MKKYAMIIFGTNILFCTFYCSCQLSISSRLNSPTGYLGAVLKKAPSIAVGKIDDFDGRFRSRMMGEFVYCSPRKDEFDIYSYVTEGDKVTVFPGTQKINLYMSLTFSFGYDMTLFKHKSLLWFAGPDLMAGMILRQYEEDIPYVLSGTDFSGLPFIGIRSRTGLEYAFNKITLFTDISRSFILNTEGFILSYNDYGIGIRF